MNMLYNTWRMVFKVAPYNLLTLRALMVQASVVCTHSHESRGFSWYLWCQHSQKKQMWQRVFLHFLWWIFFFKLCTSWDIHVTIYTLNRLFFFFFWRKCISPPRAIQFKVQRTPEIFFTKRVLLVVLNICAKKLLRLIKSARFYSLLKFNIRDPPPRI